MSRVVPLRLRLWSLLVTFTCVWIAVGPWISMESYRQPFYSTIHAMLPWPCWTAAWALAGALNLGAAISSQDMLWMTAIVAAVTVGLGWLSGLVFEQVFNGHPAPPTAHALWAFYVLSNSWVLLAMKLDGRLR